MGRLYSALRRPRQAVEDALGDGGRVHVDRDVHVGLTFGKAAAIEHGRAVRQRALGFHVAVHPLGGEELGLQGGDDRHRVVQVDALEAQLLAIGAEAPGRIRRNSSPRLELSSGIFSSKSKFNMTRLVNVDRNERLGDRRAEDRLGRVGIAVDVELGGGRDVARPGQRAAQDNQVPDERRQVGRAAGRPQYSTAARWPRSSHRPAPLGLRRR